MRLNDFSSMRLIESEQDEFKHRTRTFALSLLMSEAKTKEDVWLFEVLPGYMEALGLRADESPYMERYIATLHKPLVREIIHMVKGNWVDSFTLLHQIGEFNTVGIYWPELKAIADKLIAEEEAEARNFKDDA